MFYKKSFESWLFDVLVISSALEGNYSESNSHSIYTKKSEFSALLAAYKHYFCKVSKMIACVVLEKKSYQNKLECVVDTVGGSSLPPKFRKTLRTANH